MPVESKLRWSIELVLVNRLQMTSGHTGAKPQDSLCWQIAYSKPAHLISKASLSEPELCHCV